MYTDRILLERVEKYLSSIYWADINLSSKLIYESYPVENLRVYEPEGCTQPHITEIIQHNSSLFPFETTQIGNNFTPSWSTKWFQFSINYEPILHDMTNRDDLHIGIIWDSNSEAIIYDEHGEHIQAFTGGGGHDRRDLCYLPVPTGTNLIRKYYVEMACNEMFGNGANGMIRPPNPKKIFTLSDVKVVIINCTAYDLYWDLTVMYDLCKSLSQANPTQRQLLSLMNEIINTTNLNNQNSIRSSHQMAQNFFSNSNDCKVNHDIYAFGHCHIDTAWLWPYRETRRKVARSWATQLSLIEKYPEYHFVASQTVQYEWLLEDHPSLFQRIQKSAFEGKFIPVGGTYVEFDANLPSGESMVRQFLYGMKFLKSHFNVVPQTFWLPDTFGYSSQLPQIIRGFGMRYFLSQKLSWNLINKFPHNTLEWRGIDGSAVIAHFPPADNYESEANPSDIIKSVENNKSKMASNRSILLFGHGDGGGGPAISHLEKLRRLKPCESVSRIHTTATPDDFFHEVQQDFDRIAKSNHHVPYPVWKGELYLELHQGTFTSQAKIKAQNRLCEMLLKCLEVLYAFCLIGLQNKFITFANSGDHYINSLPDIIISLWKDTLLNQFHDVIPGSSIGMVYEDSDRMLSNVISSCSDHIHQLMDILRSTSTTTYSIFNTCSMLRNHVLQNETAVSLNPYSFLEVSHPIINDAISNLKDAQQNGFSLVHQQGHYTLINTFVEVKISERGCILSYLDKRTNPPREVLKKDSEGNILSGNNLVLYEDVPFYWDAWDVMPYHLMTGKSLNDERSVNFIETGQATSRIKENTSSQVTLEFILFNWGATQSLIEMEIQFTKNSPLLSIKLKVDWHESHKFLKTEFPLGIDSSLARYETQFGYTERPTHTNHSTDASMFETCGHRYASLSEPGYGVALLNNCKYGYSCRESTLCLSLLRAPKSPDPQCDIGSHEMKYALLPHVGSFLEIDSGNQVTSQAIIFNSPVMMRSPSNGNSENTFVTEISPIFQQFLTEGLFSLKSGTSLVLDSIKVSEDHNPSSKLAIILRFYESLGARGTGILHCRLPPSCAYLTDLTETNLTEIFPQYPSRNESKITDYQLQYKPFQILTVKVEYMKLK